MVEISGIPRQARENCEGIVLNFASKINIDLKAEDIDACHRISGKPDAPIIAKLGSRKKCAIILSKQAKSYPKKCKIADLGLAMISLARKDENSQTCFEKKIGMFKEGRLKSAEFVRRRVKRRAWNSPNKEDRPSASPRQSQRKKRQTLNFDSKNTDEGADALRNILLFADGADPHDLQTTIKFNSTHRCCEMAVKQIYVSLIRSIVTCNNLAIASWVWNIPEVKETLSKRFAKK
eukprot:gene1609-1780_t